MPKNAELAGNDTPRSEVASSSAQQQQSPSADAAKPAALSAASSMFNSGSNPNVPAAGPAAGLQQLPAAVDASQTLMSSHQTEIFFWPITSIFRPLLESIRCTGSTSCKQLHFANLKGHWYQDAYRAISESTRDLSLSEQTAGRT